MHFLKDPWLEHFQLDLVGFLAILGEASTLATAQPAFLTYAGFLPRLVPAPQALIRTRRPEELQRESAVVVGCYSGNIANHVNHLAHILHRAHEINDYHVKYMKIVPSNPAQESRAKINQYGPLTWVSILGCVMLIALIALSIRYNDGMALLGAALLGSLSTLTQIGSSFTLRLAAYARQPGRQIPQSNVVIRYPRGAFVYVECDEEIARKLYFGDEACVYHLADHGYRAVSLAGTLTLMAGVVALANAEIRMQLAFGAAYILLNAAYWFIAAVSPGRHWDLSAFRVVEEWVVGYGIRKDPNAPKYNRLPIKANFTQALWTVIALSGTTEWVTIAPIAPRSEGWKRWIAEASKQLTSKAQLSMVPEEGKNKLRKRKLVAPDWDCQDALTTILNVIAKERKEKLPVRFGSAEDRVQQARDEGAAYMEARTMLPSMMFA